MPKPQAAKPTATSKKAAPASSGKPGAAGKGSAAPEKRGAKAEKPAAKLDKPANKSEKSDKSNGRKPEQAGGNASGKSYPKEAVFTMREDKREAAADAKLTPFLRKQKERLIQLRDNMLDSMSGVAKDTLRSRAEGSEASAFGMHQADAGSDAYDRDFALSLLSQEQDALYEIEEALKRIEVGNYGMCEMSGKPIAHARLEAIPFTRYTVECQSQLEKQNRVSRTRIPVTSLFGLTDSEEAAEGEEEEPAADAKDSRE